MNVRVVAWCGGCGFARGGGRRPWVSLRVCSKSGVLRLSLLLPTYRMELGRTVECLCSCRGRGFTHTRMRARPFSTLCFSRPSCARPLPYVLRLHPSPSPSSPPSPASPWLAAVAVSPLCCYGVACIARWRNRIVSLDEHIYVKRHPLPRPRPRPRY